ncbi:phototropin 1 [Striga asiatica]|uniref:Phototropin 1 n=1 Tax=Striga asiatica TaxID=4170 RepID=A0A5A7PFI4_STRAF|nr:phototropin 1 [Striga asiatica]
MASLLAGTYTRTDVVREMGTGRRWLARLCRVNVRVIHGKGRRAVEGGAAGGLRSTERIRRGVATRYRVEKKTERLRGIPVIEAGTDIRNQCPPLQARRSHRRVFFHLPTSAVLHHVPPMINPLCRREDKSFECVTDLAEAVKKPSRGRALSESSNSRPFFIKSGDYGILDGQTQRSSEKSPPTLRRRSHAGKRACVHKIDELYPKPKSKSTSLSFMDSAEGAGLVAVAVAGAGGGSGGFFGCLWWQRAFVTALRSSPPAASRWLPGLRIPRSNGSTINLPVTQPNTS